jgi:hypothetical protein
MQVFLRHLHHQCGFSILRDRFSAFTFSLPMTNPVLLFGLFHTSWLEILSFVLVVVMVCFNIRQSPWGWLFGITSSARVRSCSAARGCTATWACSRALR